MTLARASTVGPWAKQLFAIVIGCAPLLATLAGCAHTVEGDDGSCASGKCDDLSVLAVHVDHYDYEFDLETAVARSTLTLTARSATDCFSLPFRADAPRDAQIDGQSVRSLEHAGDRLEVCGAGWSAGQVLRFSVTFDVPLVDEGAPAGYSVYTLGSKPIHYLRSFVGECDLLGPCDPDPSHFARYRFAVDHPPGYTVLCPGEIASGETQTVCTFDHDGGPSYSTFSFVASTGWTVSERPDWNGLGVTVYDRRRTVSAAMDDDYHAGFLAFMERYFGPYPYGDNLRLFVGGNSWNAFEHPGNIALRDGFVYSSDSKITINHEIAHMWAGNQTTMKDEERMWKEAVAEYLAFVYADEINPDDARSLLYNWKTHAGDTYTYGDGPWLSGATDERLYYQLGPMVLFRQLEAIFGRDRVLDALARLLGQPRAIDIVDVTDALESAVGEDLSGYFETWVFGEGKPKWPRFTVELDQLRDGTVKLISRQCTPGDPLFGGSYTVRLFGESRTVYHDVVVNRGANGAAVVELEVNPGFDVAFYEFDPDVTTMGRESETSGWFSCWWAQ